MTTYKEIFGKPIKVLSSDPTDAETEGQVWYNSTEGAFKTVLSVGAWSSGATANTAAYNLGGAGTRTAALTMGGANSTGTGSLTSTEEYDGSSWTSVTALPGATSYTGGCGIQTAALLAGGGNIPTYASTTTREYDGTNWTAGGALNTATGSAGQLAGILTAALIAGGDRVPAAPRSIANAEEYNGSSWTSVTSLPAVRQYAGVAGIQTAALYWGGYADTNPGTPNTQLNTTLEYDGTNWTSGGALPSARKSSGGSGTQTDALSIGGNPGTTPTNITEVLNYNGTSWATYPSLASGRQHMASSSSGPSTAVFAAKGVTTAVTATMEEFSYSIYSPIAATWASGGALSTGRESMSSAGTQTAALAVGGRVGPPGASTAVESYDGSSMSSAPTLNTARQYAGGCGTQTAAITYANFPVSGATEEYNGSSWSTQPNSMSTARRSFASFGIQTAALAAGGTTGPAVSSLTEEYNGTSWTAGGALSQARQYFAGAGIETSGLVFGGSDNPNSTKYTNTEEYGGTSWTAGGVLPTGTSGLMGCGATQTAALAFGGYQPSKVATTVEYDGSAWSSKPAMGGATAEGSGAGTNVAGLSIGGSPAETGVEEFTGEIVQLDYKTLTSS